MDCLFEVTIILLEILECQDRQACVKIATLSCTLLHEHRYILLKIDFYDDFLVLDQILCPIYVNEMCRYGYQKENDDRQ